MKSYSETMNELARAQAASGDTILTKHLNINSGSEPKMGPILTEAEQRESAEERNARTGLSSLRMIDDESKAVQKTPHRVSLDSMLAKILHDEYIHPAAIPHMTICVVILENGFALVGHSTPADPENYNEELGRKYAKENAIKQMWPLEAYLLREKLTGAGEYGKVG